MPASLVASLTLHALVALVLWRQAYDVDLPPPIPVIPVEIVTIADVTHLAPRAQTPPEEEPPPPPPEPPPPPTPRETPAVVIADPKEAAEEKPEKTPEKIDPPPPDILPRPKRRKEKPADPLASVLRNIEKLEEKSKAKAPPDDRNIPDVEGDSSKPLTVSQIDAIIGHFKRCWSIPAGSRDAMKMIPSVRLQMNPDGTIASSRLIEKHESRARRDSIFRAAAEAALRAVRNPQCRRLKLPVEQYPQWKDIIINFDPRLMLR